MRKVTAETAKALRQSRDMNHGNTSVKNGYMLLHGHVIAEYRPLLEPFDPPPPHVRITLAGYPTATTIERVNGVLQEFNVEARVYRENGTPYLTFTDEDGETLHMPIKSDAWYSFSLANSGATLLM